MYVSKFSNKQNLITVTNNSISSLHFYYRITFKGQSIPVSSLFEFI